ncbi:NAD(P)-binding domain-containing protein, partial [Nocardia brasiliensis]|uniref:NAD(P)-binding domain-containing protein n=1 Tax=Nocardia brasiliensis TaxID=37326 RepID=UPI0024537687
MTSEKRTRITVLGLGRMGSAIAGRYLAAGYPTTVWNRTPGRGAPGGGRGAAPPPTTPPPQAGGARENRDARRPPPGGGRGAAPGP